MLFLQPSFKCLSIKPSLRRKNSHSVTGTQTDTSHNPMTLHPITLCNPFNINRIKKPHPDHCTLNPSSIQQCLLRGKPLAALIQLSWNSFNTESLDTNNQHKQMFRNQAKGEKLNVLDEVGPWEGGSQCLTVQQPPLSKSVAKLDLPYNFTAPFPPRFNFRISFLYAEQDCSCSSAREFYGGSELASILCY